MADKDTKPVTWPSLVGDKLYLRPATAEDVANTYHWYLLSNPQSLSEQALEFTTAKEAAEAFREQGRSVTCGRFIIMRKKDKTPVGWIDFFNLNPHNRSTEIDIVIDPDERKHGHALEAVQILCKYMYDHRGLNKLIAQTPLYNTAGTALLEKAGFKQDGTLRRHYLYKGEFHDGAVFSLLRFEAKT